MNAFLVWTRKNNVHIFGILCCLYQSNKQTLRQTGIKHKNDENSSKCQTIIWIKHIWIWTELNWISIDLNWIIIELNTRTIFSAYWNIVCGCLHRGRCLQCWRLIPPVSSPLMSFCWGTFRHRRWRWKFTLPAPTQAWKSFMNPKQRWLSALKTNNSKRTRV